MDAKRIYPMSVEHIPPRKMPWIDRTIHRSPSELSKEKQIGFGKVCLICRCYPEEVMTGGFSFGEIGGNMDYCLFLLDLDAQGGDFVPPNPNVNFDKHEGYVQRNPNLCFDSADLCVSGFCVLGSTLYLFRDKTNAVFSYELSTLTPAQLPQSVVTTLTKSMLTTQPQMKFPKISAGGCQTPDGKMLVLSTKILPNVEGSGTFELFDPRTNRWESLPDLLLLLPHSKHDDDDVDDDGDAEGVSVHSYSFTDNELYLLVTTSEGNFTLDMRKPDEACWSPRKEFKYHPALRPCFVLVKDDELCLATWNAFLLDGSRAAWTYPGLERRRTGDEKYVAPYFYRSNSKGITWLPSSSNHVCIARSHVHRTTLHPYLIIDA